MGVFKLIIFCTVFLAICAQDDTREQDNSSSTLINIRLKRESEMDSHPNQSKIPIFRKPPKLLIPLKNRNPLNTLTPTVIPRRKLVPVIIHRPTALKRNTTKNESDLISNNLTSKCQEDTITEKSEPKVENTEGLETAQTDKIEKIEPVSTDKSDNIEAKSVDTKIESNILETITSVKDTELKIDVENDEDTEESTVDNITPKKILNTDAEAKDNFVEIVEKNINKTENNAIKAPTPKTLVPILKPNLIQKPLVDILSKYKVVPGIPLQKSQNSERSNDSESSAKSNTTIPNKTVPLSIIAAAKLKPIVLKPTVTKFDDQNKLDDSIKPTDPEEIVIENNKYEELYENYTPKYTTPEVVSSELRTGNFWNDFNQAPSFGNYEKTYEEVSQPYTYAITKHPGEYVVHAIDDQKNQVIKNYNNNYVDETSYNSNDKSHAGYSNILYQNNRFTQPQQPVFGQPNPVKQYQPERLKEQSNSINKYQIRYPNRIWRCWYNNNVYIRPKTAAGHAELYKGLSSYLANVNTQRVPAYSSIGSYQNFSPRVMENQNTSPANPFRRYGYYDKRM